MRRSLAREEAGLDDDADGHRVECVLVSAEVERVVVLHASGDGREPYKVRGFSVAAFQQPHEARRTAGRVPPGRGHAVSGRVGVVTSVSVNGDEEVGPVIRWDHGWEDVDLVAHLPEQRARTPGDLEVALPFRGPLPGRPVVSQAGEFAGRLIGSPMARLQPDTHPSFGQFPVGGGRDRPRITIADPAAEGSAARDPSSAGLAARAPGGRSPRRSPAPVRLVATEAVLLFRRGGRDRFGEHA